MAVRERGGDATAGRWRRTLAHAAAADDNDFVQNLLLLLAHCVLVSVRRSLFLPGGAAKTEPSQPLGPLLYSLRSSQRFTTHPSRFAGWLQRQTLPDPLRSWPKLWRLLRRATRLPQLMTCHCMVGPETSLLTWHRAASGACCRQRTHLGRSQPGSSCCWIPECSVCDCGEVR